MARAIGDRGDTEDGVAMVEVRPPDSVREVPVWVDLEHGPADLTDVGFEPASVSIVSWDAAHVERGLMVGFPQMLLGPAVAGRNREAPVAGGRRGDGAIELWIEPMPGGEIVAAVDTEAGLGPVADLAWETAAGSGRILVALPVSQDGRRLGLAAVPLAGRDRLWSIDLLVHPGLASVPADEDLLRASVASARSQLARDLWRQLREAAP